MTSGDFPAAANSANNPFLRLSVPVAAEELAAEELVAAAAEELVAEELAAADEELAAEELAGDEDLVAGEFAADEELVGAEELVAAAVSSAEGLAAAAAVQRRRLLRTPFPRPELPEDGILSENASSAGPCWWIPLWIPLVAKVGDSLVAKVYSVMPRAWGCRNHRHREFLIKDFSFYFSLYTRVNLSAGNFGIVYTGLFPRFLASSF